MYLKSLKAIGFKSFADKTSLDFEPGITAIIGPNGCGKSNISDAIRWVLGEQSAKALRGGEMADVIFSGTDGVRGRKPTGMAEVSITIGDVGDENLKAAGVDLRFNEITVTRRVYRDGGSEYFLNGANCRLRDVQQLFMGTGIGRNSYSIMAQGQITSIIQSRPQERRMVFEEAAGITKFKQQKKEALRKLDYTEQNLLRLEDTIREVKRQIGSLQRQAGKARRYQKIMDELRDMETRLARHEFDAIDTDLNNIQEEANQIRVDLEGHSSLIIEGEGALKTIRNELSSLDKQVNAVQQQNMDLKSQEERHENRMQFNMQRMVELKEQHADTEVDITGGRERQKEVDAELERINQQRANSVHALDRSRQNVDDKSMLVEGLDAKICERQSVRHGAQSDADELNNQLMLARNELNALEMQKQANVARLEKLSAEKVQLEEERIKLDASLTEFQERAENDSLHAQTHHGTVKERQERLADLNRQLIEAEDGLDELLRRQAEAKSRKEVLQQLIESKEGFGAGAQTLLEEFDSVIGTLSDLIRVPDEYVPAIGAALGSNLQLILTQKPDEANEMLARLARLKQGGASIVALEMLVERGGEIPPSDLPGKGKAALHVVETDESNQSLLQALLGRTVIVDTLETATELWRSNPGRFNFVTLGGVSLSRQGVYTSASSNSSVAAHGSVLARRNQVDDLESQLTNLGHLIDEASRLKGQLMAEQTELQASLQNARDELSDHKVAIATQKGELNALQNSKLILNQKIDAAVFEVGQLAEQDGDIRGKAVDLSTQIRKLEREVCKLKEDNAAHDAFICEHREFRERAVGELTEARVACSKAEDREVSLLSQKNVMEERLEELRHALERSQKSLSENAERKVQLEAQNVDSRQEINRLRIERESTSTKIGELAEGRNRQAAEVERREMELSERRASHVEMQERKGQVEVEITQKQMMQEQLVERIREKHDINLREFQGEIITINITDNGQTTKKTIASEEARGGEEPVDWEKIRVHVNDLQGRIEGMGPVNLVAIEEYKEIEERFTFLNEQHDDLVNAKTELEQVIARIDKQSREMFAETFEKVRANFQKMFPDLFGGGRANLILTDDEDVLEAGVEIVASPPGKQLRSISLLSGGEQTMTAVALLFSLYQVKPSPFCVLDELDAPLDDANIDRYVHKLKEFLSHSQFIVITHSKRTIAAAGVLYGVTMQERGVSRIVSVKFHSDHNRGDSSHKLDASTGDNNVAQAPKNEEVFLAK
jgi:chromosome segregation protein